MSLRLILIRHGQTEWNTQQRVQGRTDIPLNENGKNQCVAIAKRLQNTKLAGIYSAPLSRSLDTARLIAEHHACHVEVREALTEINFGAWEGKTAEELAAEFPSLWNDWGWILNPQSCTLMNAETAEEISLRVMVLLDEILNNHKDGGTVAIVSHTMPIKLLTANLIGLPHSRIRSLSLANCAYTELMLNEGKEATLRVWNDTSHLTREIIT